MIQKQRRHALSLTSWLFLHLYNMSYKKILIYKKMSMCVGFLLFFSLFPYNNRPLHRLQYLDSYCKLGTVHQFWILTAKTPLTGWKSSFYTSIHCFRVKLGKLWHFRMVSVVPGHFWAIFGSFRANSGNFWSKICKNKAFLGHFFRVFGPENFFWAIFRGAL